MNSACRPHPPMDSPFTISIMGLAGKTTPREKTTNDSYTFQITSKYLTVPMHTNVFSVLSGLGTMQKYCNKQDKRNGSCISETHDLVDGIRQIHVNKITATSGERKQFCPEMQNLQVKNEGLINCSVHNRMFMAEFSDARLYEKRPRLPL